MPNIIKHTLPGEPEKEAKRDFMNCKYLVLQGKERENAKMGKVNCMESTSLWHGAREDCDSAKKTIHPIAIHSDYLSCVNYYDDMIQIMLGYHVPVQYF